MPVSSPPRDETPPMTMALATRMLPLVERIVADLRVAWEAWRAAVTRYDTVLAALDADMDSQLSRTAHRDVRRRAAEVEALRRELEPLGATCRSPRNGRVEWLAVVDGMPSRLLWQPGEVSVTRWEPTDELHVTTPDDLDDTDPSRS
ncbi:MAG: DUF2203 family protein [Gemmatimonadaceae bacterium]|nr:DUF2203 family protein [Gemmatimonadaceae bacterium]